MVSKHSDERRHYFDWAATAKPDADESAAAESVAGAGAESGAAATAESTVAAAAVAVAYGNPSSAHHEGRMAREALEAARARCAAVLGVSPDTLYFTSGGTESNCIPLYAYVPRQGGGRVIVSAAEHSSVRENVQTLERLGKAVGVIPIDSAGRVTPPLLAKTLEKMPDVRCAAIMAVNNETGTINDMAALSNVLRGRDGRDSKDGPPIHLHCDMVQAAGKIPLDLVGWDIDSASFSAHKIGGPRGIGLLYLRRPLQALYSGGGQERNIRPGTENVMGAMAFAACLERHASPEHINAQIECARRRWKKLIAALQAIERCRIIPAERQPDDETFSPYIIQAAFKDIPGEVMARALDDMGFAVSTGSACASSSPDRPVLAAMGIADDLSLEGIRVSQGWSTTDEEIDLLIGAITEVLKFL